MKEMSFYIAAGNVIRICVVTGMYVEFVDPVLCNQKVCGVSCHVMSRHVTSRHVTYCHVTSHIVMSRHVM